MNRKKSPSKKSGIVAGCGTAEMRFRDQVREKFEKIDGVVGIEVKSDKIVLRVASATVAANLPKSFRRRKIETIVIVSPERRAVENNAHLRRGQANLY